MHQTTKMKAQEFSILYLGKDKHARTITSKILWQAKEENISKEKHADIHSCFISFKKKSIICDSKWERIILHKYVFF